MEDQTCRLVGVCVFDTEGGRESALGDMDPVHKFWSEVEGDAHTRALIAVLVARPTTEMQTVLGCDNQADMSMPFFFSYFADIVAADLGRAQRRSGALAHVGALR